jgi:nucleoside-diphosphate-sugar epimerase
MRVFVTGATGFIGSAIVKELIGAGHQVIGLVRSEAAAQSLVAAGAKAHRGTIEDLDSLRRGASGTEGAIHTAFYHAFSHASLAIRLRSMFGGAPQGIVARFLRAAIETDRIAIETLGGVLEGPGPALVVASPTMALKPGRLAMESDPFDPGAPGYPRGAAEMRALAAVPQRVRASAVALPPTVHGDGDHGFVPALIGVARKRGFSAYAGDGLNRWPAVHRLDAARLFRLALEKGERGARYHAVAEEGVPFLDIAGVIGRRLKVPVVGKSVKQIGGLFSWIAPFACTDNPVSSQHSREALEWSPERPGLISDIDRPSYFGA